MGKFVHWRASLISLAFVGAIAAIAHVVFGASFWVAFVLIAAAMLINGWIAYYEDKRPGGFENPGPPKRVGADETHAENSARERAVSFIKTGMTTFVVTFVLLVACVAVGINLGAFDIVDAALFRIPSYVADYIIRSRGRPISEGSHKELVAVLSFLWLWGWVSSARLLRGQLWQAGEERSKSLVLLLGGLVTLVILVICVSSRASPQSRWTDKALVALFHDHKAEFVLLREMAAADMPNSAYLKASEQNPKLSQDRNRKYRDLMSQIDPSLTIGMDFDTTTRFIFESGGLSAISPGWLKGIEYIPGDPEKKGKIEPNLDHANKLPADVYLREIEPHWFVVYQRTDD